MLDGFQADDAIETLVAAELFGIGASWGGTRSLVAPMVTLGEIAPGKSSRLLAELGIAVSPVGEGDLQPCGSRLSGIEADDLAAIRQRLQALPKEAT